MIIAGSLLIGILIVVALVIGALVVYIRFAVKREPSDADSLFLRLLKTGDKNDQGEEEDASPADAESWDMAAPGGLSLPVPGGAGEKPAASEVPEKKAPLSAGLGGVLSGMFSRKSKDKIKEEARAIDDQLNNVLKETSEINVFGQPPQISAEELPLSDGRGMKELDMEMGALQGPLEIISPDELKAEPPALDLTPATPAAAAAKPEEPVKVEQKKPDAAPATAEAEASKSAIDFMADDKKGAGDDLLDDLESGAKQVETVDLSIMKEYQDMPITCVEIESDLKGILDQITINGQNRRSPGR